jgi:hypothetical protein
MRAGTASGGLCINAAQRGATVPLARRVTRQDSAITRFFGAFLNSQARAFCAPDGAASVTNRPTTAFRAVGLVSPPGFECASAPRIGTSLHDSSLGKWNETVGTSETREKLYFRRWPQEDGLWKSDVRRFWLWSVCHSNTAGDEGRSDAPAAARGFMRFCAAAGRCPSA